MLVLCVSILACVQIRASIQYGWFYTFLGVLSQYTGIATDVSADGKTAKGVISYDVDAEKVSTKYTVTATGETYTGDRFYDADGNVYGIKTGADIVKLNAINEYYKDTKFTNIYTGSVYFDETEQKYYGVSGGKKYDVVDYYKPAYYYTNDEGQYEAWYDADTDDDAVVYTDGNGNCVGYKDGTKTQLNVMSNCYTYTLGGNTYIYDGTLTRTYSGTTYGCVGGTEVTLASTGEGTYSYYASVNNVYTNIEYTDAVLYKDGKYYGCLSDLNEVTKTTVYTNQYGNYITPSEIASVSTNGTEITITKTDGSVIQAKGSVELYLYSDMNPWNAYKGDLYTKTIDGVKHCYAPTWNVVELTYTPSEGGATYIDPASGTETSYDGNIYTNAAGEKVGCIGGTEVVLTAAENVKYTTDASGNKVVFNGYYLEETDDAGNTTYYYNNGGTAIKLTKCSGSEVIYNAADDGDDPKYIIYTGHVFGSCIYIGGTEFEVYPKTVYKYYIEGKEYNYEGAVSADGTKGIKNTSDLIPLTVTYTYRYIDPRYNTVNYFESTDETLTKYTIEGISVDLTRKFVSDDEDPTNTLRITLTAYDNNLRPLSNTFSEPIPTVKTAEQKDVTNDYTLTFSLEGETVEETNSKGVVVVRSLTTGTTVEKYYGNVVTGSYGEEIILITATPKSGVGDVLTKSYGININAEDATAQFDPAFAETSDGSKFVKLDARKFYAGTGYVNNVANVSLYYIAATSTPLPTVSVTTTNNGGKTVDITDRFTVSVSYTGGSEVTYGTTNNNGTVSEKLSYAGMGNQYNYQNQTSAVVDAALNELANYSGTLTYTFTPKEEYAGIYETITENITVGFNTYDSGEKSSLHLSLPYERFTEDNVTGIDYDAASPYDTGYTIHVYKYGTGYTGESNNYQYDTPIPVLLTESGSALPVYSKNKGTWGDFQLLYKVVTDSTYMDDCKYDYFKKSGEIVPAGEATGATVNNTYVQVSKPGLLKVAVYAVLSNNDNYGYNLRKIYEPVKDADGNDLVIDGNTVYTEPVYYYIDVMKRVPTLYWEPDPNTIAFVKGDKVNIPTRFELSAKIDNSSNGIEGYLKWGAEGSETIDGKEVDHFAYDFFISDRLSSKIRINDWARSDTWEDDGGDDHSFIDWFEVTEACKFIGQSLRIGDKILVDGQLVEITNKNIDLYKGRTLQVGDYERGITYHSMKGWGNESWTMEFLAAGKYNIPYVIRPWNHTRWDNGLQYTVDFDITDDMIYKTKIKLGYEFQTAKTTDGDSFLEPSAKVVVPTLSNYDITDKYSLTYFFDVNANGDTIYVDPVTGTKVDPVTGQITVGTTQGNAVVHVHATRLSQYQYISENVYDNPDDATYTIRIINPTNLAGYEVISSCKNEDACELPSSNSRFKTMDEANGRFHFTKAGLLYGGTTIYGVPGMVMTIGANNTADDNASDWKVKESTEDTKKCCTHETASVYVEGQTTVAFDSDGIPASGSFFKFEPTASGFLTADANFIGGHTIMLVSLNSSTGKLVTEQFTVAAGGHIGDYEFEHPLIAGETYYLYDVTSGGSLRLHGFKFDPAFVNDRNTTREESDKVLTGVTFVNGLSSHLPSLTSNGNLSISYEVVGTNASDYATVNSLGKLSVKKMTMEDNGDIDTLTVKATIKSMDATLGDCLNKSIIYKFVVLDIPTYAIGEMAANEKVTGTVTPENITTDITLTFGQWTDDDNKYNGTKEDTGWAYKSTAGAASRIGSELADTDPTYNKTIDGFEYFVAANSDPVDENNTSALHNNNYRYFSGTAAENSSENLNTTYNVPCRGAFLKFEPRESGDLMIYLVQNGSVDFHYGVADNKLKEHYLVKWRPLYITDETGRPVDMVNEFGDVSAMLLPTGEDQMNPGSFTLGLSRCSQYEKKVLDLWETQDANFAENYKKYSHGTYFSFEKFNGSDADIERLKAAWPGQGERESIIRLDNGGFALAHKAYVRYAFHVKAGKSYFVFQPGSKFEFGGFSFVPVGYPDKCKYNLKSTSTNVVLNATNQERDFAGNQFREDDDTDIHFTWNKADNFTTSQENLNVTINDRRASEIEASSTYTDKNTIKPRTFTAGTWEGVCLPFSVSSSEAKRVFGEDYQVVTFNGMSTTKENTLQFVRHGSTYLEAARPYLVKPSQDGDFTFRNVTIEGDIEDVPMIDSKGDETVAHLVDPTRFNVDFSLQDADYTFKGIYMRETMPAYSYFVKDDGLYRYNADTKIGGYRAYFRNNSGDAASNAKAVKFTISDLSDGILEEQGEETGIMHITADGDIESMTEDGTVYSIDGKKIGEGASALSTAAHGVYVIGGKKIVK